MGRKSSGVAKGGLITGIIGTSLAGALAMGLGDNCGNGGLLGNLFGGRQCGPIPELRFYVDKLPVNIRGNTVRLSFEPRIPPVPIDTRVYVVDHDSKIPVHDSLGSFIYARTLKDIIELRSEFIVPYVETAPHIMPGIICLNPLRINLQVDTL